MLTFTSKKTFISYFIIVFVSVFFLSAPAAYPIKGIYTLVKGAENRLPKDGSLDQVKLIEVFSISCVYCYNFFKSEQDFKKKFDGKLNHQYLDIGWIGENLSKFLYLADDNNKLPQARGLLFKSFHEAGIKDLNNPKTLGIFAKQLKIEDSYIEKMNADAIVKRIAAGSTLIRKFGVDSTPTFIIEDSILVKGGDLENLSLVINSLLKNPVK